MLAPNGCPAESLAAVDLLRREGLGEDAAAAVGRVRGGGRPHRLRYMPAPRHDARAAVAFAENQLKCPNCGKAARPAILMFDDIDWLMDDAQSQRFNLWKRGVLELARERAGNNAPISWEDDSSMPIAPLRVVILEIGAGNNVPTVRMTSESCLIAFHRAGAVTNLVRVNYSQPLCDRRLPEALRENVISVMSKGLPALQRMHEAMPVEMQAAYTND